MNPTTPTIPNASIYGNLLAGSPIPVPQSDLPDEVKHDVLKLNELPLYALNYYHALIDRRQANPADAMKEIGSFVTPQGNGNAFSTDDNQIQKYLKGIESNLYSPIGRQENKTTVDVSGMSTDTKNYQYGTGNVLATEKNPIAPSSLLPPVPKGNYGYRLPTTPNV